MNPRRAGVDAGAPKTPHAKATKRGGERVEGRTGRGGAGRRPMRGCSAKEGEAQRSPRAMRREGGVERVAEATDGPEASEPQSEEASPTPPRATRLASV